LILLIRDRTPQSIHANFRDPKRIERERELLERQLAGNAPQSSVWGTAKKQLRVESDGKCAYCEGKASHVAHGDVEHFRPKSEYWWLAYCYDNYVYSCQICNQSYKGKNFPCSATTRLAAPAVPPNPTHAELDALAGTLAPDPLDPNAVQQFHAAVQAEQAGIPDPYLTDPELLFTWSPDDTLREVEIQPRDASPAAQGAFHAVENFLGLNRDELKLWRYETYEQVVIMAQFLKSPGITPSLQQRTENRLRRMMSINGEFAGMVRFFVREVEGLAL
jgi:uncharacterized protein (TIGR02646 family)